MNGYFQRLIDQSGLVAPPSAPPAAAPAAATPDVTGAGADVVELHDERIAPAPPSPQAHPPPSAPAPRSASPAAATPEPIPLIPPADRTPENILPVADFVVTPPPSGEPPVTRPSAAPTPVTPVIGDSPFPPEIAQSQLPPEILQAIMKWIAAGPSPSDAPAGASPPPPPEAFAEASVAPPAPAAPFAPPSTPAPATIPERVIQIVEEHVALDAAPLAPPPASVPVLAHGDERPPPGASRAESPVRVSIGSIQVHVEAPPAASPPAPPAARTVRAAGAVPTPAFSPRSTGLSRLRRYYIIPH